MNFRTAKCPDTGEWLLVFGHDSELRFDRLGVMTEAAVHRLDRQFRHSAQAVARKAAAQARAELARPGFGSRASQTRRQFIDRTARIANQIEAQT